MEPTEDLDALLLAWALANLPSAEEMLARAKAAEARAMESVSNCHDEHVSRCWNVPGGRSRLRCPHGGQRHFLS